MSEINLDLAVEQGDLVDLNELLQESAEPEIRPYNSDSNDTDDDIPVQSSPKKHLNSVPEDIRSYPQIPQLKATPLMPQRSNSITDELFLITNKKSKTDEHSGFLEGRRLNNSIMVNMVHAINGQQISHQRYMPGDDWELDDQLRSRFYKGRPTPSVTSKSDRDLDRTLDDFLVESNSNSEIDFDKENINPPMKRVFSTSSTREDNKENFVSGVKKGTFGPPGSARSFHKQGRGENNSSKIDSNKSIPVLRPLTSNRQRNVSPFDGFMIMSKQFNKARTLNPENITRSRFEPRHRQISHPLKPILKYKKLENQLTFIVDSLTGSVHDATQFGTELNSVNCNGFPLPETINEIVQIPTTEGNSEEQKVAFIKAFKIAPVAQALSDGSKTDELTSTLPLGNQDMNANPVSDRQNHKALGYYSYNKYLELKEQSNTSSSGVQIQTQQPLERPLAITNPTVRKRRGGFHDEDEPEESLALSSSGLERSSSPIQVDGGATSPLKKRKVQWSTNLEW